jgi:hypothetical protein
MCELYIALGTGIYSMLKVLYNDVRSRSPGLEIPLTLCIRKGIGGSMLKTSELHLKQQRAEAISGTKRHDLPDGEPSIAELDSHNRTAYISKQYSFRIVAIAAAVKKERNPRVPSAEMRRIAHGVSKNQTTPHLWCWISISP